MIGAALGYVHVYEINLQTGGTSLPVTISYDITQFNGSLVADGCDTNVTPQDLKVRVQDGAGNYARVTLSPESLFIAQIDEEVTFTASRGGSRKRLAGF